MRLSAMGDVAMTVPVLRAFVAQSRSLGTELESVFKSIPNHRFFLETDTIEKGIHSVYDLAAKYKNLDLTTLKLIIENNFKKVFTK